ncbi:MAG TPA: hypothetical protein VFV90_00680 [Usitatibacter sp.]|jgi:hypothetical protein|nr:hypothetical protein [Usitatibacter sp.]
MAPAEKIPLPFRWQFLPSKHAKTGTVVWSWRAYAQTGAVAMQSEKFFETLTECVQDAREKGYDKT